MHANVASGYELRALASRIQRMPMRSRLVWLLQEPAALRANGALQAVPRRARSALGLRLTPRGPTDMKLARPHAALPSAPAALRAIAPGEPGVGSHSAPGARVAIYRPGEGRRRVLSVWCGDRRSPLPAA